MPSLYGFSIIRGGMPGLYDETDEQTKNAPLINLKPENNQQAVQ